VLFFNFWNNEERGVRDNQLTPALLDPPAWEEIVVV
jgi:hypothetical protein